jgi:DGQHR domain-containing protein
MISPKDYISYDVIKFKQGDYDLIFFVAPAKDIWNHFAINRRIENKDDGYQRTLSLSRVKQIARYVEKGNTLPLSILVSLEKDKYKYQSGKVFIKNEKDVGWIIDGQHRVAGAHESKLDIDIPVISFIELNVENQINQFVTINKEAKGVPTSLYYDLLKHLPIGTPSERAKERSVDIANSLRGNEESPFYGKIVSVTAPKKGELSLSAFAKKISPIIYENKGFFSTYSLNEQVGILDNYYKAIKNTFPQFYKDDDSIFFKTTGFGALIRVLPHIFSHTLKIRKGFTVADITSTLNEIKHFNFDEWKKMGTGNVAEIQAADELREEIEDVLTAAADGLSIRL